MTLGPFRLTVAAVGAVQAAAHMPTRLHPETDRLLSLMRVRGGGRTVNAWATLGKMRERDVAAHLHALRAAGLAHFTAGLWGAG